MAGGHNYLVCRQQANSVSKSVLNELIKSIDRLGVRELWDIVPSQSVMTCANGYQILFSGLDDVEKIKSITPRLGVITDIWIEEATETGPDDIKQLRKRLRGRAAYAGQTIRKRIILTFNPIFKTHWIYRDFFMPVDWTDDQASYIDDDIRILKTTHIDNQFLDDDDHRSLENESDPYWHAVYTLGNWGTLGDAILRNWRAEDLSGFAGHNFRNGLDFGYSSDPAAFVRVHYDQRNKRIYVIAGWSDTGMTNPAIADRLKPYINSEVVFCDSAEPKSIQELKDNGIDARPVKKGANSILYSIQWLQQHEIIVDAKIQGMINELSTWQWKKDKNGESLPIPVDKNNHYIDALRYAMEIEYVGVGGLDLS